MRRQPLPVDEYKQINVSPVWTREENPSLESSALLKWTVTFLPKQHSVYRRLSLNYSQTDTSYLLDIRVDLNSQEQHAQLVSLFDEDCVSSSFPWIYISNRSRNPRVYKTIFETINGFAPTGLSEDQFFNALYDLSEVVTSAIRRVPWGTPTTTFYPRVQQITRETKLEMGRRDRFKEEELQIKELAYIFIQGNRSSKSLFYNLTEEMCVDIIVNSATLTLLNGERALAVANKYFYTMLKRKDILESRKLSLQTGVLQAPPPSGLSTQRTEILLPNDNPEEQKIIVEEENFSTDPQMLELVPIETEKTCEQKLVNTERKKEDQRSGIPLSPDKNEGSISDEEKVFLKYNAAQLDPRALLQKLEQAIEKFDQNKTSPMYKAADFVQKEAKNLSHKLPESDLKKWKMSVVLALNVLETPKDSPEYPDAVRLLKANADHRAIGKSDGWKRFKAALAMLAGTAIIGLSIAGIPFTGGASLAGFYVAGSLLTVGGAAFFYHNRQKSLAKETATLAREANRQLTV